MSLNIHGQFSGGGVCINCTQNTAGINCETCVDGYFRPHKISPYDDNPCVECSCDPYGSLNTNCAKDEDHSDPLRGILPGQCHCREGYAGEKCDRCSFGYSGYPDCTRCNCSLVGSTNIDPCEKPCHCKENVEGENCDRCKQGFYNLQDRNRQGCTECFCFGVSGVCESLPWAVAKALNMDGWMVVDRQGNNSVQPHRDHFDIANQISINNTLARNVLPFIYYWKAPSAYLGNKLTAYGGFLTYTVSYDIPLESADSEMVSSKDVIIEGNGKTLHTGPDGLLLQPFEKETVQIQLLPENFVSGSTNQLVDRDLLMTVLANVSRLLIRASYDRAWKAVYRLGSVTLDTANPNAIDILSAADVEYCECPHGYAGISCEACLPGYYRVDGILFGGNCQPCECNGHASECDIHGECYDCQHNTVGPHCDECLTGFYKDPSRRTEEVCQLCSCPLNIASNNFSPTCHFNSDADVICDQCLPGYSGPRCERCANGYYGNPLVPGGACNPCDCNGNVDPLEPGHCDPVTGICLKCIHNTAGQHCEICADGYYGDAVAAKNCHACDCHVNSSYSEICSRETGECHCKPNVTGQRCDQCLHGHYGLNTGFGCIPCNCNKAGSVSEECTDEGYCHCVPGVTGKGCSRCAHGYYGFGETGCTPCDCAHTHNNCNPESGECICPPHTQGPKCELCDASYWGHDPNHGCKFCNCSDAGSTSTQCDLLTGQCPCMRQYGGEKCEQCAVGYRAFPQCLPCNCNINGTRSEWCDEKQGVCSCEEETGTCSCKENVFGSLCDECTLGTFALRADNPNGCSPCFCFGVSKICSELEGHVRIPITLTPDQHVLRVVTLHNLTGTVQGIFSQPPDILLDTAALPQHQTKATLYWRLPDQFVGDKLLSYGGKLKYTIAYYAFGGSGSSDFEPQVVIKGGHTNKLTVYTDAVTPDNGVRTEHGIDMIEHHWRYFNSVSDQPVTRADFLNVLSNVDHILIKASYGTLLQQSRISSVSLEVATEAEEEHHDREVACLIESCNCPPGYTGLSCQECNTGYYRQNMSGLEVQGPLPPIGPCVPCHCNNHSEICDIKNGKCQGCRDNTAGDYCDVCTPGYYGRITGSISDCSLCACPRPGSGSFSPTCVLEGDSGFQCDACFAGYEGQYCERCSLGYFGEPNEPGGHCHECQCSPSGSLHSYCDRVTGQCACKQGVMGYLCDQCEPRHILMKEECASCDDNCTGVLLDDLDSLHLSISSINLTGIRPAPYGLLFALGNTTRHLKMSLSSEKNRSFIMQRAAERLDALAEDTENLDKKSVQVLNESLKLHVAVDRTLNQSQKLMALITGLHTTTEALAEMTANLNETLDHTFQVPNSTFQQLQTDSFMMLEVMRRKNFTDQHLAATAEFTSVEALLQQIDKLYRKPYLGLNSLKKQMTDILTEHSSKLQEAQDLVNEARTNANETNRLLYIISSTLSELSEKKLTVENNSNTAYMLIAEGHSMMDVARAGDIVNETAELESYRDDTLMWSIKLRKHVDDLVMQMAERGVLELVFKSEDHAATLQRLADSLNSALLKVRNISLNSTIAVHAHTNIYSLTKKAEHLSVSANKTASGAWDMIIHSEESLEQVSKDKLSHSMELQSETADLSKKSQSLVLELNGLKERVSTVRSKCQNISELLKEPVLTLKALSNATTGDLQDVKDRAISASTSTAAALEKVRNLTQQLLNTSSTLSSVNNTLQETSDLITSSSMVAVSAEEKVKEAETQANLLLDRLKPLKVLEDNISRNLSEIRELISQARKQAASIKVAMLADRDCIRAYKPTISSQNYNTLTLNVKTTEPDNLLFYMGSRSSPEFLAVEMRRGKVSLLWDVGSGTTRLDYPDLVINNNRWHRIHAARFAKRGSLSVQELDSSERPAVKTAVSPGTATVLTVDESTVMFVGGIGGQIRKSAAVKVTHFKGCMGEASLNGKSIGLWNYMEREGKCGGCFGSRQNEDSSFHFDGSGYAVVEKLLRSTVTQMVIFFNTFSPNGLLVYLVSSGTKDYLTVELVDGKVSLTFDLGTGPLTLTTDRRYNNGTWYKVAVQRNKKKGVLVVTDFYNASDRETKEGDSPGWSSDLDRMAIDPIYIGGLPRSVTVRKQLSSRSYVGCIKNLEISRSTFDLLKDSYGVRKGCTLEPIRSATVLKDGFIELQPKSLSPESEILATFATKNNTGILLAGLNKAGGKRSRRQAQLPFFAVMLIDGHIEVHVNAGDGTSTRKLLIKSSSGTFSDGQEHSVIFVRNKRSLSVQVDEANPSDVKLGPLADANLLNFSNFYIGGVPSIDAMEILKTTQSFYGCIKNLIFDMELLDFTAALRYSNVDMGSCLLSEQPKADPPPDESEPLGEVQPTPSLLPRLEKKIPYVTPQQTTVAAKVQCATDEGPAVLTNAFQFGLAKNSHVILPFDAAVVKRKFSLQLNIRTYTSSGLVYLVGHQNQMDYAVLQLYMGQLHFLFDLGNGLATATVPRAVSDGKWHSVKTEIAKKKGTITVDGIESVPVTVIGSSNTLDVEGKLYLGGLPSDYTAKKLGNVTYSVPGCIEKVNLNNKLLGKESPLSIHAVSSCYAAAQEGTFFDGTGFATLAEDGYKVRSDVIITFQFRTTSQNGVLLGISSAKVDAVGLEIVNGKVLFHVNNGAGRVTATYEPPGAASLCDGKWHKVHANKSKHHMVLTVDGNAVRVENPYVRSTAADTDDPIYVGGYPANVKQNCLTIQDPFHGCMRNLQLIKGQSAEVFDFSESFILLGVFPHSCPGAGQ
ncbi:laminin subunit alpha-1 [Protopterus annectens]|uniref:laminin subunit alpha-1 n=1 Tax=Protopterus annectens TaxID=7888 RepID=UPI001CF9F89B|nr:laminin subunit alpha-1 [Protopterus annectens]